MKIVMMTNILVLNTFVYFNAAYLRVRLCGGLLALKAGAAYTQVRLYTSIYGNYVILM